MIFDIVEYIIMECTMPNCHTNFSVGNQTMDHDALLQGHESQALQTGFHSLLRGLPPSEKHLIRHFPHFQETL